MMSVAKQRPQLRSIRPDQTLDLDSESEYTILMTTNESKPYLGRCRQCDYAVFATEEDLGEASDYKDVLPGRAYRLQGRGVLARCTNNHRVFPLKRIEGTYSEDFKCDSRCLNAKSNICRCSCGGLNHGRGHAVQLQPVKAPTLMGEAGYEIWRDDERQVTDPVDERVAREQAEDIHYPKQHLGERGEQIRFQGKLDYTRDSSDSTLYVFLTEVRTPVTGELLGEAKIEWWKPSYVNVEFVVGEVYNLKAKVKRHDDSPKWGKATVVTYLEEFNE
jgi:hypothetical protein